MNLLHLVLLSVLAYANLHARESSSVEVELNKLHANVEAWNSAAISWAAGDANPNEKTRFDEAGQTLLTGINNAKVNLEMTAALDPATASNLMTPVTDLHHSVANLMTALKDTKPSLEDQKASDGVRDTLGAQKTSWETLFASVQGKLPESMHAEFGKHSSEIISEYAEAFKEFAAGEVPAPLTTDPATSVITAQAVVTVTLSVTTVTEKATTCGLSDLSTVGNPAGMYSTWPSANQGLIEGSNFEAADRILARPWESIQHCRRSYAVHWRCSGAKAFRRSCHGWRWRACLRLALDACKEIGFGGNATVINETCQHGASFIFFCQISRSIFRLQIPAPKDLIQEVTTASKLLSR